MRAGERKLLFFFKGFSICAFKKTPLVLHYRVGSGLLGGVNSHSETPSPAPAEQGTEGRSRAHSRRLEVSVNPSARTADQKLAGVGAGSTRRACSAHRDSRFVQVWGVAITQTGTRNN